jgi:hypothetical protein
MDNLNRVKDIISDYKNKSNNDVIFAMQFLNEDFESTKKTLIELTNHLDLIEINYNQLLNEYDSRNGSRFKK